MGTDIPVQAPTPRKTPNYAAQQPKPKGIDDTFLAGNQSKRIRLCFLSSDAAIMDCTLLDFDKFGLLVVVKDEKPTYVFKHSLMLIYALD
jgi:sRNA-binding regulator protein Hfq